MAGESDDLKSETNALIDAWEKTSAWQKLETQARLPVKLIHVGKGKKIEMEQLIERDRIENSFGTTKTKLESVIKEVAEEGDSSSRRAAWEKLTAPRPFWIQRSE